jgi:hypothetical protein
MYYGRVSVLVFIGVSACVVSVYVILCDSKKSLAFNYADVNVMAPPFLSLDDTLPKFLQMMRSDFRCCLVQISKRKRKGIR